MDSLEYTSEVNGAMNDDDKESVISDSGDAIATFKEIQCLTPSGRYDIKIFHSFFQLYGKTFDYKIPMPTVLRLFLLPHKDNRQMFFVVSLDPPVKQGQTRYHYLVLLFNQEETTSIELPFSEEELKEKYEDKLPKELSGPTYEILGKVMKVIINRRLTGPGSFIGNTGTPAVGCSFKAEAGYLYPLERGFMYVHKPAIHIQFKEIASVNFARGGGSTRSFDFEIELTSRITHTFSSIEKREYGKLFDYINAKKLRMKNRGKGDKVNYDNDFGGSDQEAETDAYLARVKAEAEERDEDNQDSEQESIDESRVKAEAEERDEDNQDSEQESIDESRVKAEAEERDEDNQDSEQESIDEDFNPYMADSDIAAEYDSYPDFSDSDQVSDASGESEIEEKKKKEEQESKSAKTIELLEKKNKGDKKKESPSKAASGSFKSKGYISDDESSSDEDYKKKKFKSDSKSEKSDDEPMESTPSSSDDDSKGSD